MTADQQQLTLPMRPPPDGPPPTLAEFLEFHSAIVRAIWRRNWQGFCAAYPLHADWIITSMADFPFAESLYRQVRQRGALSRRQMAAIERCMTRRLRQEIGDRP